MKYASEIGFDRIEIYTGPFANYLADEDLTNFEICKNEIVDCINAAYELNLGINAGHDLNLDNLPHLIDCGSVDEVSICLLYTSPSPRDATLSRMPSSA